MTKPVRRFAHALTAALALTSTVAVAEGSSPLGSWMKSNMGTAKAAGDFPTLQKNFDFVSGKAPAAAYSQWASFAKAGSAAAAKQDAAGVKAACGSCHDAYKDKYKKEFATRPFP